MIEISVLLSSNGILLQVGEYCMRIGYYNGECFRIYEKNLRILGQLSFVGFAGNIKSCIPICVWYYFDIVEAMVSLVLGHMYFWIDRTWGSLASNNIRNRIVD